MTRYYKQTDGMYILAVGVGAGGTEITKAEYNALLAEIREKAQLVDDVYNGVKTLDDVPAEWRDEIQRRVTERQEAEAEAEPEQSEMDDMAAALTLLGVTPEEG